MIKSKADWLPHPTTHRPLPEKQPSRHNNAARLFGYDIFISFALGPPPRGTQSYASDLARRLREHDFAVFFSEDETSPGDALDEALRTALQRSKVLVVIANLEALETPRWIRKEVEEFRRHNPKRPVIPISVDGALQKSPDALRVSEWLPFHNLIWLDESLINVVNGIVGEELLARLILAPMRIGSNAAWRWVVRIVLLSLAMLAIGLAVATKRASDNADDAIASARDAKARQLVVASELYSSSDPDLAQLSALKAVAIVENSDTMGALRSIAGRLRRLQATLAGSKEWTVSADFSPDGTRVVTGSADGTVVLWNTVDGMRYMELIGHSDGVLHVAFSSDGRKIVTTSLDHTAILWDAVTGSKAAVLAGHMAPVQHAAFVSTDFLVTADRAGWIRLWSMIDGKEIAAVRLAEAALTRMDVNPNGRILVAVGVDGSVYFFDTSSRKPVGRLAGHKGGINYVRFSPDGTRIATAGADGTAKIWNASSHSLIATLSGHRSAVTKVIFDRRGERLVTCAGETFAMDLSTKPNLSKLVLARVDTESPDNTVRVWKAASGKPIATLEGHSAAVNDITISPDNSVLASASSDGLLKLWRLSDGTLIESFRGHRGRLGVVAFDSSGGQMVTAAAEHYMDRVLNVKSSDRNAKLWDARLDRSLVTLQRSPGRSVVVASHDGKRIVILGGDANDPAELWNGDLQSRITILEGVDLDSVAFDRKGERFIAVGKDGSVAVRSAATGQKIRALVPPGEPTVSAILSPDGRLAIIAGKGQPIRISNVETGTVLRVLSGNQNNIRNLTVSPDGYRMTSHGADGKVDLWAFPSGEHIVTLGAQRNLIKSVSFSQSGALLATGGQDGRVTLWNAETGREQATLHGHTNQVNDLVFSPNDRWLATGSADRTARLWDIRTQQALSVLRGPRESVVGVAFNRDGSSLVVYTGADDIALKLSLLSLKRSIRESLDALIRIWHPASGRLIETYDGHKTMLGNVTFLPEGTKLVSTEFAGQIKVWPCISCASSSTLTKTVSRRVGRHLTAEERAQLGIGTTLGRSTASAQEW